MLHKQPALYAPLLAALLAGFLLVSWVEPPVTIQINGRTPYGDVAFYTNFPDGSGPVLGERKAPCWDKDQGVLRWSLVVNVLYDNIGDAMAGRPMSGVRYWYWYVKYSNGRLCGPAGWTWQ